MASPTVSVILPVYNGENYLRFAIESVLNQTYGDFELIIVDDGSTDPTPEIVSAYHDARLRYVRQDNTGVTGAVNHGLRLATGKYISWLSHDDVFLPDKLRRQVDLIAGSVLPAVCYTDVQMIDARGEVTAEHKLPEHNREEILRYILSFGPISSASYSIMYDRRCVDEVGPYSDSWPYTQDAEMLLRLARKFPFLHLTEFLMQVRDHDQRGVRSRKWENEVVRFFSEHIDRMPPSELFPELAAEGSRAEQAKAYQWLGDRFLWQQEPFYRIAIVPYRKSLRYNPISGTVLRRLARLALRYVRRE